MRRTSAFITSTRLFTRSTRASLKSDDSARRVGRKSCRRWLPIFHSYSWHSCVCWCYMRAGSCGASHYKFLFTALTFARTCIGACICIRTASFSLAQKRRARQCGVIFTRDLKRAENLIVVRGFIHLVPEILADACTCVY